MKQLFVFLFACLAFVPARGDINEGDIRLGIMGGHVGLLGDVGSTANNALGLGGFVNYTMTSEMQFELGYLESYHNRLKHTEFSAGINLYFNSYDVAYFAALAGVDFIGHNVQYANASSSGMALYAGLGVDFELNKNFGAGIHGKYHHAFDTTVTNSAGQSVKAIQSFVTVLARIMYIIPNS